MPAVQTTQIATKGSSNERPLSTTTKRVPLRALQMLTQSVTTRDYVQPIPISEGTDHQKKSPLALLAATCSSIGKTEMKQDTALRETLAPVSRLSPKTSLNTTTPTDNNSQRNKLSTDETKSSFKPYKSDEKEPSGEKPGFRAPTKEVIPNDGLTHSSHSKSPEFRTKGHIGSYPPFQYPYYTDSSNAHCFYQPPNRMCGMYFDLGHQPSAPHHSCLKTDCTGNCGSVLIPPSSLAPPTNPSTPSLRAIFPSTPVSAPSTVKSHGLPSSASNRSNPLYPRCNCGYCNQTSPSQESVKQHPGLAAHYHRDYLQSAANCQDPYCTNCKSQMAPSSSPTSPRGCGPHCFHHHHENPAVLPGSVSAMAPAMSHMYPYGFMLRSQSDQPNQYVCNWVQDSKNCGKSFPTSDELLQHLRTHTSAAAATNTTAPVHTPCNIPGCPCSLKSSLSGSSRLHSTRYHPYFIPSPGTLHSPSYHTGITPYISPHGIPYASPFKPY